MGPNAFNGTFPLSATATFRNHLDTLHSDYAFIIAPTLVKSLRPPLPDEMAAVPASDDVLLYPNPAHDHLIVAVENTASKHIGIADLSGRNVMQLPPTTDQLTVIPIERLAQGAYWVTVRQGEQRTVKKLIVQ
jgi:peptidoglycan/xylan/chitin deacetylase (PgdA/CDA1 family)